MKNFQVTAMPVLAVAILATMLVMLLRLMQRKPVPPSSPVKSIPAINIAEKKADAQHSIDSLKQLYFKLHNVERYESLRPAAKQLLQTLLSESAEAELAAGSSLMVLRQFSATALDRFVQEELELVARDWKEYLLRRRRGSPRELVQNATHARTWLVERAPLKLVDGAWLGHIHKARTPKMYRNVTRASWQVLSEELGDGDAARCHALLFAELLAEIGSPVPPPDSEAFIQHEGMADMAVWGAGAVQLLISLWPDEFLPEILGYNLNFEMMGLDTLMAARELREVGIDPYYFTLHITIDNADSGHTAMASRIVQDYLEVTAEKYGEEAAQKAWKRVQTGYALSKHMNKTPSSSNATSVGNVFRAKAQAADGIHHDCPMKLNGEPLSTWLDPSLILNPDWQTEFLYHLSNKRPWVVKGNSGQSRLIQQISWRGSMFGAFTDREVSIVKDWIDSLIPPGASHYAATDFTIHNPNPTKAWDWGLESSSTDTSSGEALDQISSNMESQFGVAQINMGKFLGLWFAHPCLLESFVSVPWFVANETGCAVVQILRAQHGLLQAPVHVHGIDEMNRENQTDLIQMGEEMMARFDPESIPSDGVTSALDRWGSKFTESILAASAKPQQFKWILLGLAKAFVRLHAAVASSPTLLSSPTRASLTTMAATEQASLAICTKAISQGSDAEREFSEGYKLGLLAIAACLS